MKAPVTLALLAALAACRNSAPAEQASASAQDAWMRCVTSLYEVTSKQTADKSAAAEQSFRLCNSEESELKHSLTENGSPPETFAQLRAQMKQILMEHP